MDWLQGWYSAQCDEDWEHEWGVRINTLDNPGWSVRIDLEDTDLEAHSQSHRGTHPLPRVGWRTLGSLPRAPPTLRRHRMW
ncbi:Imm53 family immunity protein [Streptomyces sp. NPDC002431]